MMPAIAKLTGRFTEAEIDDEIVIMRIDNGEFFALSGTAAAIWRLIDGRRDSEAVIAALADQYMAGAGDVATEVGDFLTQLEETGLLGRS